MIENQTNSNVFVEEFSSVIPMTRIPLASADDIRKGLDKCNELSNEYDKHIDELKLEQKEQELSDFNVWKQNVLLDFGDWLVDMLPGENESTVCAKYADSDIIRAYCEESASERSKAYTEIVDSDGSDDHSDAIVLARSLMTLADSLFVTMSWYNDDGTIDNESFYIPMNQMNITDLASMTDKNFIENALRTNITYTVELGTAISACEIHGNSTMTVACVSNDDRNVHLCSFIFANGSYDILMASKLGTMMSMIYGEDNKTALDSYQDNIMNYDFADAIGYQSAKIAACLMSSVSECILNVIGIMNETDKITPMSFPVPFKVMDGDEIDENEATTIESRVVVKQREENDTLMDIYDGMIEKCSATPAEACLEVYMSVVTDLVVEICVNGNSTKTDDEVRDFFMEAELAGIEFNEDDIYDLRSMEKRIEQDDTKKVMEGIYEDLPAQDKNEIDSAVDAFIDFDGDEKDILVLSEKDLDPVTAGDTDRVDVWLFKLPGNKFLNQNVPGNDLNTVRSELSQMCVRCMHRPETRMLVIANKMHGDQVFSSISWKNGKWSDTGFSRTRELLYGTNIMEVLGFPLSTDFHYEKLRNDK